MQESSLIISPNQENVSTDALHSSSRLVGLDFGKGFGILAMVLIHAIIQQIAEFNGALFVPTFSSIPLFALILLIPVLLLALWGTAFTTFYVIGITNQMINIPARNSKKHWIYIGSRVIIGFFILFVHRISSILRAVIENYPNYSLSWRSFYHVDADTLDAIVWAGVICVLVFYGAKLLFRDTGKVYHQIAVIFMALAYLLLLASPWLIKITNLAVDYCSHHNIYLGEYVLGKFARGRFKLFQTLAFGFMGISFGVLLHYKVKKKVLLRYTWSSLFISCMIAGIMILVDPAILNHFADEDVPTALQILNLGGLFGLITIFFASFDYVPLETQQRRAKKSRWVMRYGLITLTAFSFDTVITRIPFRLMCLIFGPSVEHSVEVPYIRWMWWQIIIFVIVVWIFWEIVLRLWEKINFVGSLDWWLAFLLRVVLRKGSGKISTRKILYGTENALKKRENP